MDFTIAKRTTLFTGEFEVPQAAGILGFLTETADR